MRLISLFPYFVGQFLTLNPDLRIGHRNWASNRLPHLNQAGDGAVPAPTAGYSTTNELRAGCSEVDRPQGRLERGSAEENFWHRGGHRRAIRQQRDRAGRGSRTLE